MQLVISRLSNHWVFDDDKFNLTDEPFVSGINEIIDRVIELENIQGNLEYKITFSDDIFKIKRFYEAKKIREDSGGAWYGVQFDDLLMAGWLCPCIHLYFPEKLPDSIYFKVEINH